MDDGLQSVVNPAVMLSPLTQREAVLSSKTEGLQATVDEVLEFEAGMDFDPEKTKDIQEIVNYRKTWRWLPQRWHIAPLAGACCGRCIAY